MHGHELNELILISDHFSLAIRPLPCYTSGMKKFIFIVALLSSSAAFAQMSAEDQYTIAGYAQYRAEHLTRQETRALGIANALNIGPEAVCADIRRETEEEIKILLTDPTASHEGPRPRIEEIIQKNRQFYFDTLYAEFNRIRFNEPNAKEIQADIDAGRFHASWSHDACVEEVNLQASARATQPASETKFFPHYGPHFDTRTDRYPE
jgi:hypothetical protein